MAIYKDRLFLKFLSQVWIFWSQKQLTQTKYNNLVDSYQQVNII